MSDDIKITVDGQELSARKGQMLIEVTDAAGIDVPRFCYHKKLSVAANCRMCLVEVEKAPKPLPACATPCMPDMVVKTKSKLAREAQQGTMEFLLINHPLDCPICDQGGECELQDVAMGYGGSASQYTEGKRIVLDKYIGPLIATEMTRCIHCTRCVRFGEEIAGIRELGATGRGENVRIGTYIEKSVVSEVSGNVIDICPVGALTARPSRFTARAWELRQQPSVSAHDSVGANTFVHLDGNTINRVVPRDNEAINEVWIADRDRFSYAGINSKERVTAPMVRVNGQLQATDWSTALDAAADALAVNAENRSGHELGVLASASATLEELYLAQKLGRALGTNNIDHRLGQSDCSAQDDAPVMPWLGMQLADLESLNAALLIGSNIRKDQPLAALRLRKSAMAGGKISFLNPRAFPLHFDAATSITIRADRMVDELLAIAVAAGADVSKLSDAGSPDVQEQHKSIAEDLNNADRAAVVLGNISVQHPAYSALRYLAAALAKATNSTLSMLPERANTAGAWLAGVVPHRGPGGKALGAAANTTEAGQNAAEMLTTGTSRYLLLGTELEFDAANPAKAIQALSNADQVVAISAYMSSSLSDHASVVLPMAQFPECYGTFVNATGAWQSVKGVSTPPGESRPAWKIMRVLAEKLSLDGFNFDSPEVITKEVQQQCGQVQLNNLSSTDGSKINYQAPSQAELLRAGETPIYATDPLVRRSQPLQNSSDGKQAFALMADTVMQKLGIKDGDTVKVKQGDGAATLPVKADNSVPDACVWVPTGLPQTQALGDLFGPIQVSKS